MVSRLLSQNIYFLEREVSRNASFRYTTYRTILISSLHNGCWTVYLNRPRYITLRCTYNDNFILSNTTYCTVNIEYRVTSMLFLSFKIYVKFVIQYITLS